MFSAWALWILLTARPTHCMWVTSTTSSNGSTASEPPCPNSRGLQLEFSGGKPSQQKATPLCPQPQSVTKRKMRTVLLLSLAPNWGLRRSPKPDWTRSYRDHWRGRKLECSYLEGSSYMYLTCVLFSHIFFLSICTEKASPIITVQMLIQL